MDNFKSDKENFLCDLRDIMGLFSDAIQGFNFFHNNLVESQKKSIEILQKTSPEHANKEYLDKVTYSYGEEITPVNKIGSVTHHEITHLNTATFKDLIERNNIGGENYYILGNLTIVMIYHLWENTYRPKFEERINRKIEMDIFGDLAQFRHMILKHNGILNEDAHKKIKLLKYYSQGEKILINSKQISDIIKIIEEELSKLE